MSFGTLGPFFALAFGLSWGVIALLILFPEQIEAIFGELSTTNPLFILAVYSPGIAGVLLVFRHYGVNVWVTGRASSATDYRLEWWSALLFWWFWKGGIQ